MSNDFDIDPKQLKDANLVLENFIKNLRPPKRLSVSEWADTKRFLSSKSSAEAGKWRTDRAPYLRKIMDCLSYHHPCQKIVVPKGAQVGMTEAGMNWIGYIVDEVPSPVLMVMPTDETAKKNVKTRIEPMLESTPELSKKVGLSKSRDKENTTMLKQFVGGFLACVGANSPVGLRSLPIRFLMLDEVDGYPKDVKGEGSPVNLAIARTRTFGSRKKIFMMSTPTLKMDSVIWDDNF